MSPNLAAPWSAAGLTCAVLVDAHRRGRRFAGHRGSRGGARRAGDPAGARAGGGSGVDDGSPVHVGLSHRVRRVGGARLRGAWRQARGSWQRGR